MNITVSIGFWGSIIIELVKLKVGAW